MHEVEANSLPLGSVLRVECLPQPGWLLLHLSANGVDISKGGRTFALTEDTHLVARFGPMFHKLSVRQEGEGHVQIMLRDGHELLLGQIDTVRFGTELLIAVKPAEGWQLAHIRANGDDLRENAWHAVREHTAFDVRFVPNTYYVSVLPSPHGALRVEGYAQLDRVPHGTRLSLHPEPETGYGVKSLLVNGEPLEPGARELSVAAPTDLQAVFAPLGSLTSIGQHGNLLFYPNPAVDLVHLADAVEGQPVTLFSTEGRELQRWYGMRAIPVGHLPAGTYLISVGGRMGRLTVAR